MKRKITTANMGFSAMPADTAQHQHQFSFQLLFRQTLRCERQTLSSTFKSNIGFSSKLTKHRNPAQQKT
jgi:hypothetical protein